MGSIHCPRCNQELDFIQTEKLDNGLTLYEYLCTECFAYVQEVYEMATLIMSISGDLKR